MFMQVTAQAQVATTLTQVGNILNSARQGGSWMPRKSYKSRVTSTHSPVETSIGLDNEAAQTPKLEPEVEEFLSVLTNKQLVEEVYQMWKHSCEQLGVSEDFSSMSNCVSEQTFFENKTGFKESSLEACYRQSVLSFCKPNGPKLLMTPSVIPFYQQSRGFLSVPKNRSIGMGFKDKKDDEATDKVFRDTREFFITPFGTDKNRTGMGFKDKTDDKATDKVTKINLGGEHGKGKNTVINVHVKGEEKEGFWDKMGKSWMQRLFVVAFVYSLVVLWNKTNGKLPGVVGLTPNNYEINPEAVNVTFKDVKGIDEVKEELEEIVNFLTNPEKFQKLGARLPKGVLLVGPPGVGKTLVAKAIAGEAGVPFFHASGSEFDEIFVGMGAKRVRQLFASAKMKAPSIVFIDEIDAVGSKRVNSPFTPHANQTINQLLSEMDGFSTKDGVIVIGATNKKNNLDRAILRPGRFDMEIGVSRPDIKGRSEMFRLYLDKVKRVADLDIDRLAKITFGSTGADICNIVNQAALNAAKHNREAVIMEDLLYAKDKCSMGPEMKNRSVTESDKYATACHEAGHAIVGHYTKHANPVNKVTVMPRGSTLGHTQFISENDSTHSFTKQEYLASLDVSLGGRLGEEFSINESTAGCSSDFQTATNIASMMVLKFGMSEKVGVRVVSENKNELSNEMKALCDSEISRLLKESGERAKKVLETHKVEFFRLVDALMKQETVDKEELEDILNGNKS